MMRFFYKQWQIPFFIFAVYFLCMLETVNANDWRMWRHDAGRTATTTNQLPSKLSLAWTIQLPKLQPAWTNQPQLQFDVGYQPIVAEGKMFVASSLNDSLTAFDVKTGKQLWQFFAEGPIRFAPAATADGKVLFSSDDGHLYCVHASDGKLIWKFRGGPSDRKVLGNKRLISAWPARGAPVIADGKVYFAASIWPFMGTFIYALDIKTGAIVWKNNGTGSLFLVQPHDSSAFGGVTPQGYLAISGDSLFVPNGRAVPASFNLATGKLNYFHLASNKRNGNYAVTASEKMFVNSQRVFDNATGKASFQLPSSTLPVLGQGILYCGGSSLKAYDLKNPTTKTTKDRKGRPIQKMSLNRLWKGDRDYQLWLKAGNRLYGSQTKKQLAAFQLQDDNTKKPSVVWTYDFPETVCSMIAANERLIVTTIEGNIFCFSKTTASQPVVHKKKIAATTTNENRHSDSVKKWLKKTKVTDGYCLAYGLKDGSTLAELAVQTQLQIIGVDSNQSTISKTRKQLDRLSLYGSRISAHQKGTLDFNVSPYLADLIVANGVLNAPDYTRTCKCAYQNQTSLALIHMPQMEMWTFNDLKLDKKRIRRLGINLGAPGDRKSSGGTLWLEYPYVGGPSPKVPVTISPKNSRWFRNHPSSIKQSDNKWISASGVEGVKSIKMTLNPRGKETRKYTVRLHFSEPKKLSAGDRVFSVFIQDNLKLSQFDPRTAAGGQHQTVIKEFTKIDVKKELVIKFKPKKNSMDAIICGIEVIEEPPSVQKDKSK